MIVSGKKVYKAKIQNVQLKTNIMEYINDISYSFIEDFSLLSATDINLSYLTFRWYH